VTTAEPRQAPTAASREASGQVAAIVDIRTRDRMPPPPPDPRPTIHITTDLLGMTDAAIASLVRHPDTYQRRGHLGHVVRVAANETESSRLEGTPEIRAIEPATVRERLGNLANWEKWDARSKEWVSAVPPLDIIAGLLARGQWRDMRPLDMIAESPYLRPDGHVAQTAGYDGTTRCLYVPACTFPSVPQRPTRDDAVTAFASLREVLCDFPFKRDADRDVPLASLLTMIARPAILGAVPMFLFDATTRGSGKTLTADCVSVIATGRPAPRMSWPSNDEELEKVLGAYAMRGASLIVFDNVESAIRGGPLNKVLTASGDVELRVLGRSEIPSHPWRAVVIATGNNMKVAGDTERRVIKGRIEPDCENPEDRATWKHPRLLEWLTEQRPRLVVAALTILRAYAVAGWPDPLRMASFEPWSAIVPSAILWAGGGNVLNCLPTITGEGDPERQALRVILDAWERLDPPGIGITMRKVLARIYSADRAREAADAGSACPDEFDDLRESLEQLAPHRSGVGVDPARAGLLMLKLRGQWADDRQLEKADGHGGVQRWRVVKRNVKPAQAELPAVTTEPDPAEDFPRD
jgi:hypothetical protein